MDEIFHVDGPNAKPVWCVAEGALDALTPAWRGLAQALGFKGQAGRILALPGADGQLAGLALGLGATSDPTQVGALATQAPAGLWRLQGLEPAQDTRAALAFALSAYRFERYKSKPSPREVFLVEPPHADMAKVTREAKAVALTRDLINTPAEDLGPEELSAAAQTFARDHGGHARVVVGEHLLAENYPLIHAVGRASTRAPRLVDLTFGDAAAPKVTLVGKGVCFDTGGLDLKTSSNMALMKKDMGGAAHALGLASLLLDLGLPIRLRVILALVDNAVAGNAFRTSDVFKSRKGISVEISNTDAEGRLILADALADADAEAPDLLIDLATLTGAARVALGPDVPPFYCDDDKLAVAIQQASAQEQDPLWRLPLHAPYAKGLESKIADIKSQGDGAFAGSITAALFLQRFVQAAKAWVHVDVYAWSTEARPAKPFGGEAQGIRALAAIIAQIYPAP